MALGSSLASSSSKRATIRSLAEGKLRGDDVPDEVEIDAEVAMDELVSHPCHLAPRHSRLTLPQSRRHPLRGLSDNLEVPHDSVLNHRGGEEGLSADSV